MTVVFLPVRSAVAAALALLLVGCTDSAPAEPDRPDATVDLGLTQLLVQAGGGASLLRVINRSDRALDVEAVGLAWPGYGGSVSRQTGPRSVPGGSELMFKLELPEPECDGGLTAPEEPVMGTVVTDGGELTQPLTDAAQGFVRRLWRRQCAQEFLATTLRVGYAPQWQQRGAGESAYVRSSLRLTRLGDDSPVRVLSVDGSVLFNLRLPGGTVLPAGVDSARIPLDILPGDRCDEHGIGQATAPYDFLLTMRIGDRKVTTAILPPLPGQEAASAALLRKCGQPVSP
jgi:hypothetical protein